MSKSNLKKNGFLLRFVAEELLFDVEDAFFDDPDSDGVLDRRRPVDDVVQRTRISRRRISILNARY